MASTDTVAAIDALVAAFYAMFDNRNGASPLLATPEHVFLPDALIVRRDGDRVACMHLDGFIGPRRAWLSDGTLSGFHEWETASRTAVAGDIATRLSAYRKQGLRDGTAFDGEGAKSLQLVRAPAGWRIASVLWQDGGPDWRDAAP
ncbi:DUF4440 domain-containing protein [Cognatilysobacter lacus]|uniref:DUF4440 domain-containing protein n=1 Tax=Cognatilysobacter lacus TaxID=1643323 RepID=A0A5D8YPI2_9GAMM|nr:DUF4440 domain-containing protein [Lysobacter lacus]TZF84257.1 DUF4440 domain-containing protein [Lysobacter lacus]